MILLSATLIVLAQAEAEPPPAEAPAPPPAAEKAAAPDQPAPLPHVAVPQQRSPQQLQRDLEKIKKMDPQDATEAMKNLAHHLPQGPSKPGEVVIMPDIRNFNTLPEQDQAKYFARDFFSTLLAGDARKVVGDCGFPFQLEDRRLATPEELFGELLKNLRAKRTDLLTLYDVELLSPADMEKKYGKPPSRLNNLNWRGAHTWVAVGNLSGHAAVAVVRLDGSRWNVIGYHD